MHKLIRISYLALIVIAFSFCKDSEKADENLVDENDTKNAVQETKLNAQNVFNSMPDRKEILILIEDHKIEYNSDLLSDPGVVHKYNLESSKAANLGIYGSDLSIASSFEQTQESMVFLKCVNLLANDLGVSSAFDAKMVDRMEANKQNKDSTLEIITNAFKSADEILKNSNRPATSAIILAGAWIEGLHVSCQIAKNLNSEAIVKSILKQKESLKNLIVLLDAANITEGSMYIVNDLKNLQVAFKVAEENNTFTNDNIKDIISTAEALRRKIISGL